MISRNMAKIRPGVTFRDLTFDTFVPDIEEFHHYTVQFHGVGMADEWPMIGFPHTWEQSGWDGVVEVGMVLCVESFVARRGCGEGCQTGAAGAGD